MDVGVNGEIKTIKSATLAHALIELGYADQVIATAVNSKFVPISMRGNTVLHQYDTIEVLAPMQGG